MRNTPGAGKKGTPPTCGGKYRAATPEKTTSPVKPWKFGTLTRTAYPGIFELCQAIGNARGEAATTPKSKALCVYFQRYSASITRYLPKACSTPAWNSLRQPGRINPETQGVFGGGTRTAITGILHPVLAIAMFSLNGVSMVRA